ncbi:MAG: hypothetical protein FWC79_01485 [Oscillospiraceae bacterium]|nr:hypothetical protein [Oscillospiraceae bacterium]
MKKFITVALMMLLFAAMTACGSGTNEDSRIQELETEVEYLRDIVNDLLEQLESPVVRHMSLEEFGQAAFALDSEAWEWAKRIRDKGVSQETTASLWELWERTQEFQALAEEALSTEDRARAGWWLDCQWVRMARMIVAQHGEEIPAWWYHHPEAVYVHNICENSGTLELERLDSMGVMVRRCVETGILYPVLVLPVV